MRRDTRRGFSLLEILLVLGIIAIIGTIVVPTIVSMMSGSRMSEASDQVAGSLSRARQMAIAHNRTVEVRLYRFGDPEVPGEVATHPETGRFRAIQIFEYDESGLASPVTKAERLPLGIIFDSSPALSTLLDPHQQKKFSPPLDAPVTLPRGVGENYQCAAFQFTPSGSTKLGFGNWFVTLHNATTGDGLETPPPNYAIVQVDAISGTVKVHRP